MAHFANISERESRKLNFWMQYQDNAKYDFPSFKEYLEEMIDFLINRLHADENNETLALYKEALTEWIQ